MRAVLLVALLFVSSRKPLFEIQPVVLGGGEGKIRLNFQLGQEVIDYEVSTGDIDTPMGARGDNGDVTVHRSRQSRAHCKTERW